MKPAAMKRDLIPGLQNVNPRPFSQPTRSINPSKAPATKNIIKKLVTSSEKQAIESVMHGLQDELSSLKLYVNKFFSLTEGCMMGL